MKYPSASWLGKYRDLFLAIALFLVLDLGVLFFNLYTSVQIGADAARINAAGELRVYSQQLTKALLTLSHEIREEQAWQTSLAQVEGAHRAFREAFADLRQSKGAAGIGFDRRLTDDAVGMEMLDSLGRQWEPLSEAVLSVLETATPLLATVDYASNKAVTRNLKLMQLADDLTRHLESVAQSRAASLRYIQIAAILLATLNFVFIVLKFLRRLSASDRQIEEARRETQAILATVREGLFLLGRDGCVGEQHSASLAVLFGKRLKEGAPFLPFLMRQLTPEVAEAASEYINLLYNKRVKPALLEELNPLREVAFARQDAQRSVQHLSFEFTPVEENGEVVALLVTVFDVTQKVRLQHELAGAQARVSDDIGLLLSVLEQEPAAVADFLESAESKLLNINRALQEVKPDLRAYAELINQMFRMVHSIKGEAGALSLSTVTRQAHAFEEVLAPLRRRNDLRGDDLIPLAVEVAQLREQLLLVSRIVERAGSAGVCGTAPGGALHPVEALVEQIEQLALKVADDLNKKVRFEAVLPYRLPDLDEAEMRAVREALPQLVRNAVVHGIESSEERRIAGKDETGLVRLEFAREAGGFSLLLRDDGRGISPEALRERAISLGHCPQAIGALDDTKTLALMFEPGFSTELQVDQHAGRGVGLDALKAILREVGARLRVTTHPHCYTQFKLQFSGQGGA